MCGESATKPDEHHEKELQTKHKISHRSLGASLIIFIV
jgi:hypothetical protein